MKNSLSTILLFSLVLWGCKVIPGSNAGNSGKKPPSVEAEYEEDLSSVRPRYSETAINYEPRFDLNSSDEKTSVPTKTNQSSVPITGHVNAQVAAVLDSMTVRNRKIKFVDGFRVQIYVGNVRADVEAAKSYAYQLYPDISPYMTFEQPTYRLKVGDFMSRSEAEKCLTGFRAKYPSAVIVADKIDIRKGVLGN